MNTFTKVLALLSPKERKQTGNLLVMIMVVAFLDMMGVASIMPFIAVLANPDLVETNVVLSSVYHAVSIIGVSSQQQFLVFLGILVFVFLLISLVVKSFTAYHQVRFAQMRDYSIGMRLLQGYLVKSYAWFLNSNSAELKKMILSEVNIVVRGVLMPIITIVSQSAVTISIFVLLLLVNPKLALITILTLSFAYALIFKVFSAFNHRIGQERAQANQYRFMAIEEAFGAIKDVKLIGLERVYSEKFSLPAETYAKHQASSLIISQLPRFAIEAVAFGGLLIVVIYLMQDDKNFDNIIPIISLYAFAGYRLMPALQQIYGSFTQIKFAAPALDLIYDDIMDMEKANDNYPNDQIKERHVQLTNSITLNNVFYTHPNSKAAAINGVSLRIQARSRVGFVGETGSGKTTLVDIICGLLKPQAGTLEIDGKLIDEYNIIAWYRSIGYVSQQIYLADDSIAANIAFGIGKEEIDQAVVERVAKIAKLHDFVTNDLPEKYQTKVGERGVRLSGGQIQRIAIARALYHNPKLLILDEGTSALDNLTELEVVEAIQNYDSEITIIMIAHRLNTVRNCDSIFLFEDGVMSDWGTYEELMSSSKKFRKMVKIVLEP